MSDEPRNDEEPRMIRPKASDQKATVSFCPFCKRLADERWKCARKVLPCPPIKTVSADAVAVVQVSSRDGCQVGLYAAQADEIARSMKLGSAGQPGAKAVILSEAPTPAAKPERRKR